MFDRKKEGFIDMEHMIKIYSYFSNDDLFRKLESNTANKISFGEFVKVLWMAENNT